MKVHYTEGKLILAVYPSTKGFGFAVFESPRSLIDWGMKGIAGGRDKNVESLRKLRELLAFYQPDILVVRGGRSKRAHRISKLIEAINNVASKQKIASTSLSRPDVWACFSRLGSHTKREIAEAIVREFPELEPRLPPVRRIWMSEDARMSIFDAVALGITFFHTTQRKQRAN